MPRTPMASAINAKFGFLRLQAVSRNPLAFIGVPTVATKRGGLTVSVSATGTVDPITQIQVGPTLFRCHRWNKECIAAHPRQA